MEQSDLRIYNGPDDASATLAASATPTRCLQLSLGELLPLLVDAYQRQRTWLRDFDDDAVTISSDLYEVLLAYQHYRRPSA